MSKDEIFSLLLGYIDFAMMAGFFTEDEIKQINEYERKYFSSDETPTE